MMLLCMVSSHHVLYSFSTIPRQKSNLPFMGIMFSFSFWDEFRFILGEYETILIYIIYHLFKFDWHSFLLYGLPNYVLLYDQNDFDIRQKSFKV